MDFDRAEMSRRRNPDPAAAPQGVPAQTELPLIRARNLAQVAGVLHGFTTRKGGVSEGPWGPLNLAARTDQPQAALVENWRRAVQGLHPGLEPSSVALLSQVHGAKVLEIRGPTGPLATAGAADAAWTRVPGVVLAVRTADCVPVLVAGRGAVAVAHAGWRGTVAGVVPVLIEALVQAGEAASDLVAAVGPAISGQVYTVGREVVDGLRAAGLADEDFLVGDAPLRVDLQRAVSAQLRRAGVQDVEILSLCTYRDARMHSHRRDGARSGRQAGLIALDPSMAREASS